MSGRREEIGYNMVDPAIIEFLEAVIREGAAGSQPEEEIQQAVGDYTRQFAIGQCILLAAAQSIGIRYDPEERALLFQCHEDDDMTAIFTTPEINARRTLKITIGELIEAKGKATDPVFFEIMEALNNDEPLPILADYSRIGQTVS